MSNSVTLTIDDITVTVPKGTVVVDAAKLINNDIPVFCYHPKMKPVGMCRMCLVEVGMPVRDRETRELITDDEGKPKINFGPVLQTGCTVQAAEGMVVRTNSSVVTESRDDILEFLLTSHPLDCPICDKGGECPLQNLTMDFGPGTSRFDFNDKKKQDKHVPLGDLIYLDRERCIQCARCTRFQSEIADDPVIAFHNRGRSLEIVTMSEPGFDSYWSGNTTDICPVGALTTADFRFGARPWEMIPVASICPHCPVGCNTTMSTRMEAKSGGRTVIKRIMPRQNESVNEIWICDKGRFVHHFADSPERLQHPMVREEGELVEATWETALDLVAGRLKMFKSSSAGLASGRLSNEDLYQFQKVFGQGLDSKNIDLFPQRMAGGDIVAQAGIASGSNLKELGLGDALLVVASDLHEEAPVWWLRVKQAHIIQFNPGEAPSTVHKLLNAVKVNSGSSSSDVIHAAADTLIEANNLVIFYGAEGLTYDETDVVVRMLANLLLVRRGDGKKDTYHAGRVNNGLIAAWSRANTQGAWDMGVRPDLGPGYQGQSESGMDAESILSSVRDGEIKSLYLVGVDPVGDGNLNGRGALDFLVVQDLFLTESAKIADVVLPAQSWAEREGTFTNGERRVQRFYPAIAPVGKSRADWLILAQLGERLGLGQPPYAASILFKEIADQVPQYRGMDYRSLARSEAQWPRVGGDDLYYGGNAYNNQSGLGQQWPVEAESREITLFDIPEITESISDDFVVIPIQSLYRQGTLIDRSNLINSRVHRPTLMVNFNDARGRGIVDGDVVIVENGEFQIEVKAEVNGQARAGIALLRGMGSISGPIRLKVISK
jgi:NADH-quinone oxidoreductase subunit G